MRDDIPFIIMTICFFLMSALFFITRSDVPELIGYGCDNSRGLLYANSEDHFPLCERIEENR